MTVCGLVFLWTEPGRRRSAWDRAIGAKLRAHPRQALGGFLVGVATWGLFPLGAALPQPTARFLVFLAWPLLMLMELVGAAWWWWRHGWIEELADGERTMYLPTGTTHPVFWGWIWGTVGTLLLFTMLAQMPLGR
jgi:hypothetical protein